MNMNWELFILITYGFILGVLLLVLSFYLYSRWIRRQITASVQASAPASDASLISGDARKIDFQQIERLVRLHQDVKDDLSNYGDVLVAMRNEQLTASAHQQKQIDICLGFIEKEQRQRQAEEQRQQEADEQKKQQDEAQRQQQVNEMRRQEEVQCQQQESVLSNESSSWNRYKVTQKTGTSAAEKKAASEHMPDRQPARHNSQYQGKDTTGETRSDAQPQSGHDTKVRSQRQSRDEEKQKNQRRAVKGETPRDQVMKLIRFGMEPDMISQKTGLSLGEIDLMISLNQKEAQS